MVTGKGFRVAVPGQVPGDEGEATPGQVPLLVVPGGLGHAPSVGQQERAGGARATRPDEAFRMEPSPARTGDPGGVAADGSEGLVRGGVLAPPIASSDEAPRRGRRRHGSQGVRQEPLTAPHDIGLQREGMPPAAISSRSVSSTRRLLATLGRAHRGRETRGYPPAPRANYTLTSIAILPDEKEGADARRHSEVPARAVRVGFLQAPGGPGPIPGPT